MRDVLLLRLALISALGTACPAKTPPTPITPSTVTPSSEGALESSEQCVADAVSKALRRVQVRFADGSTVDRTSVDAAGWNSAIDTLRGECVRDNADRCPDPVISAGGALCLAFAEYGGTAGECGATHAVSRDGGDNHGMNWLMDCGSIDSAVEAGSGEVIYSYEIMEGRPLLSDDGPIHPRLCTTGTDEQRHWQRMASHEHASAASFARHLLELMHLGAPAELLCAVQIAIGEELEHARMCRDLAGRVGDSPVEAGPMPPIPAPRVDPVDVLVGVLVEGCFNEAMAALIATRCANAAVDPQVVQTLRRIADDEVRHAALAWRTLAWGLSVFPEALNAVCQAAQVEILRTRAFSATAVGDGILGSSALSDAHRDALVGAVIPACQELGIVA
ncbi:MAG: hypothetical protein ACI9MC_000135 [Kiritimatiellia bacterium]|jgi:hypothetical protein